MSKLIDNVFDYDTIRYVPVNIQNEWKNLYNLYKGRFFERQKKIYNIYCSIQNDFKSDEINKLNYMSVLLNFFKNQVQNIQPKLNIDSDYSEDIKNKLLNSIKKMSKFIKFKKYLLKGKKLQNSVREDKVIEKFSNRIGSNFNKRNILLIFIFVILTYLMIN